MQPGKSALGSLRRLGFGAWFALGSVVTFVAGSGFLAVINDQAKVEGNRVETNGEVPQEDALDIQIAQAVTEPGQDWPTCLGQNVQWSDTTIPATFDSQIDVGPGERVYEGTVMCLRRLDTVDATADVTAFVGNFVQTDPTCATTEDEVDTTCGTTEPGTGEISTYMTWETVLDLNADLCTPFGQRGTGNAPLDEGASDQIIGMTPGLGSTPICVGFQLVTNMAEDSPGLRALLTDVATWDWVINAEL